VKGERAMLQEVGENECKGYEVHDVAGAIESKENWFEEGKEVEVREKAKWEIVKGESQDKYAAMKREKFEAFLAEETGQGNAVGSPVSGSNEWMEAIVEWHHEADAKIKRQRKINRLQCWFGGLALADEKTKKRLAIVCRGRGEGRQDYIRRTVLNGQRIEQCTYSPTAKTEELVGSPWMETCRAVGEEDINGKGGLIDLCRESSGVTSEAHLEAMRLE
jgi:hypothetical protein